MSELSQPLLRITPLELEVLLHLYYDPSPYNAPSEAHRNAVDRFLGEGLVDLRRYPGPLNELLVTPKGAAYIESILYTPYPVQVTFWVDPRIREKIIRMRDKLIAEIAATDV